MAEMGLGYGSEYQLLRFLGHHRNELNKIIRENTRLKGELIWLDYPKNSNRLSLDSEYIGLMFLKDDISKDIFTQSDIDKLLLGWKEYWSTTGRQPNWDGVMVHKKDNQIELVIIEAKANLEEIKSNTKSASNEKIQKAFIATQKNLNISNSNWFGKYYQLANRLALVNYLQNNSHFKINASLLYIYFLNGYEKRQLKGRKIITIENKSVKTQKEWEKVIDSGHLDLGLNDKAKQYISKIFVDCK